MIYEKILTPFISEDVPEEETPETPEEGEKTEEKETEGGGSEGEEEV